MPRQKKVVVGRVGEFEVAVNTSAINKVGSEDMGEYIKHFAPAKMTPDDLIDHIKRGYGFSTVTKGRHNTDSFVAAQHLGVDFDTEDIRSSLDVLKENPFIAKYASFLYTTPSSTTARPRSRAVFILDKPVTDATTYIDYVNAIIDQFTGVSDKNAGNAVRVWFGSKDCNVIQIGEVLPCDVLDKMAARSKTIRAEESKPDDRPFFLKVIVAAKALTKLSDDRREDYNEWIQVGMSLQDLGDTGLDLWRAWSSGSPKYKEGDCESKWGGFKSSGERTLTLRSIEYWAREDKAKLVMGKRKVHTGREMWEPQPPVDWVIEGLTSVGSTNLPYGEPGAKKTYTELVKAMCVASGLPFLGHAVKQGPVLIIDEESGHTRMVRRLRHVMLGMEGVQPDAPIYFVTLGNFNLGMKNDADREELIDLIEEYRPVLCIIDALSDVMDGDENSKEYVHPIFQFLRRDIAEAFGTAVDVIHHANKNGGYRGSSAMRGAVDSMTAVCSAQGDSYVEFRMEKSRDAEPATYAAEATWEDNDDFETVFRLEPTTVRVSNTLGMNGKKRLSPRMQWVVDQVAEMGTATLDDLIQGFEEKEFGDKKVLSHVLSVLAQKGMVKNSGIQGKKGSWTLTDGNTINLTD